MCSPRGRLSQERRPRVLRRMKLPLAFWPLRRYNALESIRVRKYVMHSISYTSASFAVQFGWARFTGAGFFGVGKRERREMEQMGAIRL